MTSSTEKGDVRLDSFQSGGVLLEGDGWSGRVLSRSETTEGDLYLVAVESEASGSLVWVPADDLDRSEKTAWSTTARLDALTPVEAPSVTIPVVEERLRVGKRSVEDATTVVRKRVEHIEQPVDVALTRQTVEVERVAIDRFVDEVPAERTEGDTLIVPVLEEVLVITKRLKLREEIHITRHEFQEREQRSVPLRRETVVIDQEPADAPASDRDRPLANDPA